MITPRGNLNVEELQYLYTVMVQNEMDTEWPNNQNSQWLKITINLSP